MDGVFLRNQPEGRSWFKISNYSEATIYYNSKDGLYIKNTTKFDNPVRLHSSYYVDWVDKYDDSRSINVENPFEAN